MPTPTEPAGEEFLRGAPGPGAPPTAKAVLMGLADEPRKDVPTEAGWYLWRNWTNTPWECRPVIWGCDENGRCLVMLGNYDEVVPLARASGIWGERIPDSDTLVAMREMAATPSACLDSDGTPLCVYCGCVLGKHATPHRPDCPWLRSQESIPPAFCAFDASEETAEGSSLAIVITDVPQEMWDAMSEGEHEDCRRFARVVWGEEKPDAPTPGP